MDRSSFSFPYFLLYSKAASLVKPLTYLYAALPIEINATVMIPQTSNNLIYDIDIAWYDSDWGTISSSKVKLNIDKN